MVQCPYDCIYFDFKNQSRLAKHYHTDTTHTNTVDEYMHLDQKKALAS